MGNDFGSGDGALVAVGAHRLDDGGTGRQLVEQHGGRIELLAAVGGGAAFRVRLPRPRLAPGAGEVCRAAR